ncbi:MAG TPA: hydroxymethylbilane synthase [Chloroflexota bacterium]|nr:hydroxymethylbilane synthase [Chloroflexota bacterium]
MSGFEDRPADVPTPEILTRVYNESDSSVTREVRIRQLIVGTRGSALALIQTNGVIAALQRLLPMHEFVVQTVKTLGDRVVDVPLSQFGSTGVFVKEIDRLLLDGAIDIAVHSLKDVPPDETPGLVLAAFPERADPRDALVSRDGTRFVDLPPGARVGTSSVRRRAQLRAKRPDLRYLDNLRGNVDTRLRKLAQGDYDAIVLAAAGLERLGRAGEIADYLPTELCLPDAGQGILAVQVRQSDAEAVDAVSRLDDPAVRVQALAERAVLRAFGGGCKVPVAAYARLAGPVLHLEALVATEDGARIVRRSIDGLAAAPEALGRALWDRLVAGGAAALLGEVASG